jgi:hypothetical protein
MSTNSASLPPFFNSGFRRYGAAIVATAGALGAREAVAPLLHESLPYITVVSRRRFFRPILRRRARGAGDGSWTVECEVLVPHTDALVKRS